MHLDQEDEVWQEPEDIAASGGELIEFKSVGLDIGSSTSHLMFSRLVLARRGREYISGYAVVGREIVYRSPIIFTPYLNHHYLIDAGRLKEFIDRCYAEANLSPDDVDTGAVITTGEAARKENAAAIINLFAAEAGKFVCATAGPNLEAVLAAHGSGAVQHSRKHKEVSSEHLTVLNVDVGGGTAKVAVVQDGRVLETCAINVGARLVAWDQNNRVTRVEEAGARVAAAIGLGVREGAVLAAEEKERLAARLAALLFEVLRRETLSPLAASLMITPPLAYRGPIDLVVYSGGVAEFVYGQEEQDFGDLGPWLGRCIRREHENWGVPLGLPEERIRATVIGASQYTVQVSSNTIFLSAPELLPLRNIPVVRLPILADFPRRDEVAAAVQQGLRLLDLTEGEQAVALAVSWNQEPEHARLAELAEGIKLALPQTIARGLPVVVVFDRDLGALCGRLLAEAGVGKVIAVDNIDLRQLSFVDIGRELPGIKAVPVTVKSLIFR